MFVQPRVHKISPVNLVDMRNAVAEVEQKAGQLKNKVRLLVFLSFDAVTFSV